MALELNLETCLTNCETLAITETAGFYNSPNNLGGWGNPNLGRTFALTAVLNVTHINSEGVETALLTDFDVLTNIAGGLLSSIELTSVNVPSDGIITSTLTVTSDTYVGTFATLNSGTWFQDVTQVVFSPLVGDYSIYVSLTGFATIAEFITDFNVTNTLGFTLVDTAGVITIVSSNPNYDGRAIQILVNDSTFDATMESTGSIITYTTETETAIFCNVGCCVEKLAAEVAKVAKELCGGCSSKATEKFISAEILYRSLENIAICNGQAEFLKVLKSLEKICNSSGCGCGCS